ncbi:TetR/AcrR family transcriptional regulator [Nocardiopsis sp. LOL_012]|uniref:TetR/AcrR family transcriptional regulator n=1 Tax=Nocardiopsis sp. LOL_012 TaxID=3345409 RepID=UPI003A872F0B
MTAETSPHGLRTAGPVLDCAARLFAEHGAHGATMPALTRWIASETGTDPADLRRAFPARTDLAYAVVLRATRTRLDEQLAADTPGAHPVERMSSLVRRHVSSGWEHRATAALEQELLPVLRAVHPTRHRELTGLKHAYRALVEEIITRGRAEGSFLVDAPASAADEVLGTLDSLLHWYHADSDLGLDDLGTVFVDLVVHHHLGCPR